MINSSSIASRVVPAISLTIAFSSSNKRFNKVDFPTFGSPTIEIGTPDLITFPVEKESIKYFKTSEILFNKDSNFSRSAKSTSSPEKSSSSSINEAKSINSSRNSLILLLKPPRIC